MKSSGHNRHREIVLSSGKYLLGSVISQAAAVLRAGMLPIFLSPGQLGVWNLMSVIIGYGAHAHLGLLHGLNMIILVLRGKGELHRLRETRDSAFWANLIVGVVAAVVVSTLSLFWAGLGIVAAIVFLQMIHLYLLSVLRADNRFSDVGWGIAALSILWTALFIPASMAAKDYLLGTQISLMVAHTLVIGYWIRQYGLPLSWHVSGRYVWDAFSAGVPLVVLGLLDAALLSVDRWAIAATLGATALGFYAFAFMLSTCMSLLSGSVAGVLYPRMLERYGAAGDASSTGRLFLIPLRMLSAVMLIIMCGAIGLLPLLIQVILPKYRESIPIARILLPGSFLLCLTSVTGNFLIAINRQSAMIRVQLAAAVVCAACDYVLLRAGMGVIGVAIGTALGYMVYGIGYVLLSTQSALRSDLTACASYIGRLMSPFLLTVTALVLLGIVLPEGDALVTGPAAILLAFERTACLLVAAAAGIWLSNRDTEMITALRAGLRVLPLPMRGSSA